MVPELPEVETMRRGLLPIVGSTVSDVRTPPCTRRPIVIRPGIGQIAKHLKHQTIRSIARLGKRVLIEFDGDWTLAIEPRMTGNVLLADPPTTEHLRLEVRLDGRDPSRVWFWDRRGLGTVTLYDRDQRSRELEARYGPDAVDVQADTLRDRLRQSRRAVKVALLDQSAVAGIGNMYAAEILFLAGVDPRTRCDRLSMPQWRRIAYQTRQVMAEAIRYEGSTLGDGTYRTALNDPGGYQNHHRVYDRESQRCPRCQQSEIRRIVQAQRSTFFCPGCQRRSGIAGCVSADIG